MERGGGGGAAHLSLAHNTKRRNATHHQPRKTQRSEPPAAAQRVKLRVKSDRQKFNEETETTRKNKLDLIRFFVSFFYVFVCAVNDRESPPTLRDATPFP